MTDDETRRALFWAVCIPVRLGVAAAALTIGYVAPRWLPLVAVYAAFTALGFAYNAVLTLVGKKRYGGFGGLVWWAEVRWVHLVLWTSTAVLAFRHVPWAGAILLADACLGIGAGGWHFLSISLPDSSAGPPPTSPRITS